MTHSPLKQSFLSWGQSKNSQFWPKLTIGVKTLTPILNISFLDTKKHPLKFGVSFGFWLFLFYFSKFGYMRWGYYHLLLTQLRRYYKKWLLIVSIKALNRLMNDINQWFWPLNLFGRELLPYMSIQRNLDLTEFSTWSLHNEFQ
jgi:hypothetical protein